MRVICPRCNAEYEIDDQLIPANGREVECSSCENVWFQPGRLRMPEPLSRLSLIAGAGAQEEAEPDHPAGTDARQAAMATEVIPNTPPVSAGDTQPPRRDPPEEVMAILREEAAHFRASRPDIGTDTDAGMIGDVEGASPDPVAEAGAMPDMAPHSERHEVQADHRPPTAKRPDPAGIPTGAEYPPAGQEVFAVSETGLESRDDPAPETAYAAPEPSASAIQFSPQPGPWRGFGKGFVIGIVIAGTGLGLYLAAPYAGDGRLGDILREWRATGNQFHHLVQGWLGHLP